MFKVCSSLWATVKRPFPLLLTARCLFLLAGLDLMATNARAESVVSAARHKIEVKDPAVASALAAQGGHLIADYGSYQLYELDQVPVGITGRADVEPRDHYNFILLNAARLDTSKPETQALRKTVGQFSGKHLHLVQFAGPVKPAWREELVAAGVQVVTYIPENTYLVYGDAAALGRVQALAAGAPHIQWEGPFLDHYKIHPGARSVDAQGKPRDIGTEFFAIQLVADAEANAATLSLIDQFKRELKSKRPVLNYLNLVVSLPADKINTIAAQPEVVSIHPYIMPKEMDERQAQIVSGNLVNGVPTGPGYLAWLNSKGFTQAQFTNSGFGVDVSDSGLDNGTTTPFHPGLYTSGDTNNLSRVIYTRIVGNSNANSAIKGCDGHGTLNSHVIGGYDDILGFPYADTNGYHYGLGICPYVKLGSSVIFSPNFTSPDFTALQSAAYRDGARVSNNSWGADTFGDYTSDSQEYDSLVRDAQPAGSPNPSPGNQEMVIVFANGNAGQFGSQSVGSPATGKNVFSIGAGENVQPFGTQDGCGIPDREADNANDIIFFSSRGPCTDERHKPDLMAPGTHVSGGVAQAAFPTGNGMADACFNGSGVCGLSTGLFFPVGQQLFTVSSGTSHSTPCVVGGCALLRQYFINGFTNTPSPAMTKAYLMNSARYMTGLYANDTLWSDNQGMGEMNLGMAFDGTPRVLRDELPGDLFTQSGQSFSYLYQVADPTRPLRVTLAWTDAPGNTTGNAYNNNLDLTVTVGGATYKGNVFNGQYSTTGGTADYKNNVESVFLPIGATGEITVTVSATSINSDGVPNNGTPLDQDFALVVYNALPPPPVINSLQPTNVMVIMGQPASFGVDASGAPPLTYRWYKDGALLAGASTSTFSIASTRTNDTGAYSVIVSNQFGTATATSDLTVVPTVPLPYALDTLALTNFNWTSVGPVPWYGQTDVFHPSGTNSAAGRSYFIGDNQQSTLTTPITGPGTLRFYWKVSSQTNADILTFSDLAANFTNTVQISGAVDWTNEVFLLPAGLQTLQWTYTKDASGSSGLDAGFLDQVSFTPGFTLPTILTQPASLGTLASVPVTFTVSATGTPVLGYQWRFNGFAIPGATSSSFTLPSPSALDSGLYSVRISNPYGSVVSADAYLGIVPLVVRGDNSLGQIDVSMLATNVVGLAAGAWHSLIVRGDGTLLAWGENYDGQCNVAGYQNIMAVAAGGYHSLGIQRDGTVVGWGANYSGQATPPPELSNVTALAAGTWHSLALRTDGAVVAWGDNSLGQCNVPPGLANVVAIAANGNHSLALRADGTVVAWGDNTDALGNFVGQSVVPFGLANVAAIGAGDYNSLAALNDGSEVAWGDNSQGQSQPLKLVTGIIGLTGGGAHTIALESDGTVLAWGNDWNGQCDFAPGISNVIAIAAGDSHSMLLEGNRPANPQILYPVRKPGQFSLWVPTFYGKSYALEYKTSISATSWSTISVVRGNGARQFLLDPNAITPQRFYRVRQF